MFIRNAWYVAGWGEEFGHSLRSLKILDEDIVFYRTTDGTPVALEDACPHRKLPLSMGRLNGDLVECGYHGLTFDASGGCVRAPTQVNAVPKNAKVHSYPVVERWDLVWIWMGASELANENLIINIENFDNPAWGKTAGGTMDIECHYLYIIDNLLDPHHVAWVHASSFAGAGTDSGDLNLDVLSDGVTAWRWVYDQPPPPYYADLVSFKSHCDRKQHYECRLPATAINKSIFTPAGSGGSNETLPENTFINISYNFITPVNAENSRYFWFQHRNTDPANQAVSNRMYEGAKLAFEEDREVLAHVQKGMAKAQRTGKTAGINLKLDIGAVRFRLLVDKQLAAEGV